jgi:hypothetical protein
LCSARAWCRPNFIVRHSNVVTTARRTRASELLHFSRLPKTFGCCSTSQGFRKWQCRSGVRLTRTSGSQLCAPSDNSRDQATYVSTMRHQCRRHACRARRQAFQQMRKHALDAAAMLQMLALSKQDLPICTRPTATHLLATTWQTGRTGISTTRPLHCHQVLARVRKQYLCPPMSRLGGRLSARETKWRLCCRWTGVCTKARPTLIEIG